LPIKAWFSCLSRQKLKRKIENDWKYKSITVSVVEVTVQLKLFSGLLHLTLGFEFGFTGYS